MNPSISMLRAVVAVHRTRHFGRAAAQLGVSVSSVSEQVSRLERDLRAPLFTRTTRAVTPTALGDEVAARAARAVEAHEEVRSWLTAAVARDAPALRIGIMSGLESVRVTSVLKEVHEELPGWDIAVVHLGFVDAFESLRSEAVDVAVISGPVDLDAVDIRGREVWHSGRVVMVDTGHRLASRAVVTLDDLSGEVLIAAGSGLHPLTRAWVVDPRPDGVAVRYGPAARDFPEAVQLVAAGLGINITASSARDATAHPGVVFIPLAGVPDAATWVLTRAVDRSSGVRAVERVAAEAGRA